MKNLLTLNTVIIMAVLINIVEAQSIRKPWREMTNNERQEYVTAINSLPSSIPQTLADEHQRLALLFGNNQHIHNSNIFLPWHRVFILYFEEQLKAINPNISLPYWDWTEDWSSSAQIFRNTSGGNNGLFGFNVNGSVWRDPSTNAMYVRNFNSAFSQPTSTEISNIVNTANFSQHRSGLETGPHNRGHNFVGGNGGTMASMFSPADPIFFLHHCMVDKVWNDWVELNWTGGTLPFDNDADSQLNMLTFIGYQGSTNANNVVRVNPNNWIDSRNNKVWYANDGEVSLTNYTVSNTENYRYTGTINIENNFSVASSTTCNVLSGTTIFLKPGFTALNGSSFTASINTGSFGRIGSDPDIAYITERLDKIHRPLLEASLEASKALNVYGNINIYGIETYFGSDKPIITYPNPSSGKFSIRIKNPEENYSIRVVDLLGRNVAVKVQKTSDNVYEVELNRKDKGYYFIKMTSDTGSIADGKIILK